MAFISWKINWKELPIGTWLKAVPKKVWVILVTGFVVSLIILMIAIAIHGDDLVLAINELFKRAGGK